MALIFRAVDLETNGVDVDACEVGQVALETTNCVDGVPGVLSKAATVYCAVSEMPEAATEVHGLTAEQLSAYKPFGFKIRSVLRALVDPDVVVVTFNGARFDLRVLARYAAAHGKLGYMVAEEGQDPRGRREAFEYMLSRRHIDACRLWQVVRERKVVAPWESDLGPGTVGQLHAGMFAGSLTAAHGFYEGEDFEGAHDAGADNRATLAVLRHMLRADFVDVAQAIKWSTGPLPGYVDFDGVFEWRGDQAVSTQRKWRDVPLERIERGYLQWMLDKDFHRHTKKIVREYLAGDYPIRSYEEE